LYIYCHGILASKDFSAIPRFVEMLAEDADAIAFDFRGHGESHGHSTIGEREPADLDAVYHYACEAGYARIYLVGSSMGAAVSLRYAAANPAIAGVATVGAFADSRLTISSRAAMRMFHLPFARRVVHFVRGARVESATVRTAPVDLVDRISPRPVLFIHGEFDPLVPRSHAEALYRAAGDPKKLIVIPRGSHDIPNLNRRTRDWVVDWFEREVPQLSRAGRDGASNGT
jgi:fermentation-respiration switch protein FrsA (DUF1100 family)